MDVVGPSRSRHVNNYWAFKHSTQDKTQGSPNCETLSTSGRSERRQSLYTVVKYMQCVGGDDDVRKILEKPFICLQASYTRHKSMDRQRFRNHNAEPLNDLGDLLN